MTRHFIYFVTRDVRNRLTRQLRRMRSPRYAIAALVGVLYFFLIFGGWMPSDDAGDAIGGQWIRAARVAGPLMLGLLASWWWLWGGHRHGLVLSPAEVNLLVPAPLTRRDVIRFKILQAQPAILFSAALGALVMRGTALPWPLRLVSLWVLLATLHQHQIAASLVHAAAEQHGRSGLRRTMLPMVLFTAAFGALLWALLPAVNDIRGNASLEFAGTRLIALLSEPGPRIALAPFRLILAPALAATLPEWPLPFAGACAVLLVHYIWLQRTDAAFEESAAAEGEKRDALMGAMRSGGLSRLRFAQRNRTKQLAKPWLPLRPTGRNAYAIVWKNILYSQRSFHSARSFIVVAIIIAVLWASNGGSSSGDLLRFSGASLVGIAIMLTLFGPLGVRNDLRMDLGHIDQLRTYPIRSRDLVAAEIAAATITLTVPQLVILAPGLALLASAGAITVSQLVVFSAGAVVALPVVNALALLVQNALALLYPSWVRVGPTHGAGMEMVGQNMIVMVGTLLLLALCAIPPLLAGALVGAPLVMLLGEGAAAAGVSAALIAAALELALLVLWLGGLYDRTDPVAAGLLR